jgi:hypothetical protein
MGVRLENDAANDLRGARADVAGASLLNSVGVAGTRFEDDLERLWAGACV